MNASSASLEGCLALIPARNEEGHIERVVDGCRAQGCAVWVIDDGSCDETARRAERAGARVLRNDGPRGKTAALRFALKRLPPDAAWIFFLDGDGQHDPAAIRFFWDNRFSSDCLIGNRWHDARQMPFLRRLTNRAMSGIVNLASGGRHPDTQCGFRLVRRSLLEGWLPRGNHFEFETELYLHALRHGARVASIPLQAVYADERSKIFWPRDSWRFLLCLGRDRFGTLG